MSAFKVRRDTTSLLKNFTKNVLQEPAGTPLEPFTMIDHKVNFTKSEVARFVAAIMAKGDEKLLSKKKLEENLKVSLRYGGRFIVTHLSAETEGANRLVNSLWPELTLPNATLTVPQMAICLSGADLINAVATQIVAARAAGEPAPVFTTSKGLKQSVRVVLEEYGVDRLDVWADGVSETDRAEIVDAASKIMMADCPLMYESTTPSEPAATKEEVTLPETPAELSSLDELIQTLKDREIKVPKRRKGMDEAAYATELASLLV